MNRTIPISTTGTTKSIPPSSSVPTPFSSSSEYVAVILASSIGTRLYPITTDDNNSNHDDTANMAALPKHMLPICGIPILLRLLQSIELCGFMECILLLKHDDTTTMDLFIQPESSLDPSSSLQHPYQIQVLSPPPQQPQVSVVAPPSKPPSTTISSNNTVEPTVKVMVVQSTQMKVTIVQYTTPCSGTVEAIRRLEDDITTTTTIATATATTGIAAQTTTTTTTTTTGGMAHTIPIAPIHSRHMVVFPGDLIVLDTTPIRNMIQEHRQSTMYPATAWNTDSTTPPTPTGQSLVSTTDTNATTTSTSTTSTNNTMIGTPTIHTNDHQNPNGTVIRSSPPVVAGTLLLVDVTAMDESTFGVQPIYKESAKLKKGLLSREEDDVCYMAIQTTTTTTHNNHTKCQMNLRHTGNDTNTDRLIWKQSKFDVEEDKEQIGTTPKIKIPKFRCCYGGTHTATTSTPPNMSRTAHATTTTTTRISTEWNDVHCYCISSWVRQELYHSSKLKSVLRYQSLQYDLMPLLISRQYRGIRATFQTRSGSASNLPNTTKSSSHNNNHQPPSTTTTTTTTCTNKDDEYMVLAHLSHSRTMASTTPSIFRSNTIASYLFANRIMTHEISARNVTSLQQPSLSSVTTPNDSLWQLPAGAIVQSKSHTILLPESTIGDKVTFKSCVIGRHCSIGHNCRLNNVVLHDYVTIGDNTTLQSTIVSAHVTIGNNCSFNDCQILRHLNIPPNTKKKGEAITSMDD